ncbi:hypothetical protein BH11PLA1_BH11PLA1_13830 [soil metagenome]
MSFPNPQPEELTPPTPGEPIDPADIIADHAAQPPVEGALGQRAARGALALVINTSATKLLQLVAVVIMGRMLTKGEFGLNGIALGISSFIATFRDGGVRDLLVARHKEYETLAGPCYWFSTSLNIFLGLLLGTAGEIASYFLARNHTIEHASDLSRLIWIIGAALPVGTPATILSARLRNDMRFGALGWQMTIGCLVRYGGQIFLALMGYGPLAFVIPIVLTSLAENIYLSALTREYPWMRKPDVSLWPEIWRQTKWIVFAAVAGGIAAQGFSVAATPFLTGTEPLGELSMALLMLYVVESLTANNIVQVTLPVMARMTHNPVRLASAAARVLTLATIIAAGAIAAAAVTFPPIEHLIWHGKWLVSGQALFVLAPAFVFRNAVITVTGSLVQSLQKFRLFFAIWVITGVASVVGAALGAMIWHTALGTAGGISIALGISSLLVNVQVLKAHGVPRRVSLDSLMRPLLIALTAGLGAWSLNHYVTASITARWTWLTYSIPRAAPVEPIVFEGHYLAQAAIIAGSFGLVYILLLRIFAAAQLRDGIEIAPARIGNLARRVLWL